MKRDIVNDHQAHAGMTLVELLITIIISSIMALTAGVVLFHTQVSWFRSVDKVQVEQNLRVMRAMVEYEIRSSTGIAAGAGDRIFLDPAGQRISYVTLPAGQFHSIYRQGSRILLNTGNADQVLLDNVTGFSISRDNVERNRFRFSIVQRVVYDNTTGAAVDRQFSFDVYSRNTDR